MKLYYALGGGMGHLSRAIAFIHSHPFFSTKNTMVMVAERDIYDLADSCFIDQHWEDLRLEKIPRDVFINPEMLKNWLEAWLQTHQPEEIYLDTFPAGIAGEWSELSYESRFFYVGRYVNWGAYPFRSKISFENAFRLEHWHSEQERYLLKYTDSSSDFSLSYPDATIAPQLKQRILEWQGTGKEVWAVVHSEPKDEVEALLSLARDLANMQQKSVMYLLCSPQELPAESDVFPFSIFPAYPLFPLVDKIITACGFNLMQQADGYRHKHHCMPFPRRYDDQFERYRRSF